MAFFIKENSSGFWYTKDGDLTTHKESIENLSVDVNLSLIRHGYSTQSEANSAITSLGLSGVTVVEE